MLCLMQRESLLRWSWANVLTKKRYDMLIAQYKNLDVAIENLSEEMLSDLGCREETVLKVLLRLEEFDPAAYEKELKKRKLELISIEEDRYPATLRSIEDPPVFLYIRGDISILSNPCIGLVGTREMSLYGKRVVETFIPPIAQADVVTISGLAFGIDAHVAKETLLAGGKTVAVLGHGFGMIYPKAHSALAEEIILQGGLLLSEFPLDVSPDKFTFPARNRIIAGLSTATVVLEAAVDSGSLITADLALDYNRDVYAVPGPIFDENYAGCHELIAKGNAKLVASPEDLLADLGIIVSEKKSSHFIPDAPEEEVTSQSLTSMPQSIDDLAVKTKIDAAILTATLTMLELKGAAKNVGEGKWVRN